MPDDRPHDDNQPDNWNDPHEEPEVPASVTFMEIMRQVAARKSPPPSPAEQLFTRRSAAAAPSQPMPATPAQTTPRAETAAQPEPRQRQAAVEEQRIQRVKRRNARRRRQTVGVLGGIVRTFIIAIIAAGLMATIFTWWTPSQFLADQVKMELSIAQATAQSTPIPTGLPTPNWLRRIGIVSGHRGPQVPPDPGAVCPDGLTEAEINFAVAQQVVMMLRGRGYTVDLLDEFDPRLDNYQAAALVSIHANTCQDFGEVVSGFLIARAAARTLAGPDDVLVECVAQYYALGTGLRRREGLTTDMTNYHTFREIHPLTPAAIIELGFMLADRPILTDKQAEMARAIADGILCFLEPSKPQPTYTPVGS